VRGWASELELRPGGWRVRVDAEWHNHTRGPDSRPLPRSLLRVEGKGFVELASSSACWHPTRALSFWSTRFGIVISGSFHELGGIPLFSFWRATYTRRARRLLASVTRRQDAA